MINIKKYLKYILFNKRKIKQIEGNFLISSNDGLFYLNNSNLKKINNHNCFGIAKYSNNIFFSVYNKSKNYIISANLKDYLNSKKNNYLENKIFKIIVNNIGSRIHQISISHGVMWITLTNEDKILKFDLNQNKIIEKIDLFEKFANLNEDKFHINSISAYKNFVLVTAANYKEGSLIIYIYNNNVYYFFYKNKGIHDIKLIDNDIYICDSFGKYGHNNKNKGGELLKNGKSIDKVFFTKPPGYVLRGIGIHTSNILIGHSHKGHRAKRFQGFSKLLLYKNKTFYELCELPFSQIYDIICIDNLNINQNLQNEKIFTNLKKSFGNPILIKNYASLRIR